MTTPDMALQACEAISSVAMQVHACLDDFQGVLTSKANTEPYLTRKLPLVSLQDKVGRFRLWCGNSGAHRSGIASLDHKLREASHIRDRVISLLRNLSFALQEMTDIVTGKRLTWEDEPASDTDSDGEDQSSEGPPITELEQLSCEVAEINKCLMRLSLAIRNPAPHDQFKGSANINLTYYESFDIKHVREKFPTAPDFLINRLGKANSRRRQYLCYRKKHRQKLSQGLELITELSKIEGTVISSLPLELKVGGSATKLLNRDNYYEETLSQTSYGSSRYDPSDLRPPPLPEEGQNGDPFECSLCYRFTCAQREDDRPKHIYQDLQPYVRFTPFLWLLLFVLIWRGCAPMSAVIFPIVPTNQDESGFIMRYRYMVRGGSA